MVYHVHIVLQDIIFTVAILSPSMQLAWYIYVPFGVLDLMLRQAHYLKPIHQYSRVADFPMHMIIPSNATVSPSSSSPSQYP